MKHSLVPGYLEKIARVMFTELAAPLTPRALEALDKGDWDYLTSIKVDPKTYVSADLYSRDAQVAALFKKCAGLPTTHDRKGAAIRNFWKGEHSCYRTNERLSPFLHGAYAPEDEVVWEMISHARKWIRNVLGPYPDEQVLACSRFGPGSTYGDRGKLITIPDKMSSHPTSTSTAYPFILNWSGTLWAQACKEAYVEKVLTLVPGNRFTTVPKDSTKDRGIAVEPSINLFYQLGIGAVLKKRLSRAGLDLQHGKEVHMQVACAASLTGASSTIDLSNASDSLCKNLVELLLPPVWFEAMAHLRSPKTQIDGRWVNLEKFSSMGNGYTFELETLVFASIIYAVRQMRGEETSFGKDCFVFGDDIIVPSECSKDLIAALQLVGFETNADKTFVDGPFRESCGGDYFEGIDVRPYFLREIPNEPQHFIAMANGIRSLVRKNFGNHCNSDYLRRTWFRVLDLIPSHVRRLRGPQDLGDIVIHDEPEFWNIRVRHCIRYVRSYKPIAPKGFGVEHFSQDVVLASAVFQPTVFTPFGGVGRPHCQKGVIPRDGVFGHKIAWVPFS
jgi:hypothetical protein